MESLSIQQARKLVLLSQKLPSRLQKGRAVDVTLSAIEHLGYVQMDTISVVQRAHHHTLWNRNPRYQPDHLDNLLNNKKIFEYWSHAAAYLPMQDYRFSRYRKEAILTGRQSHWYKRNDEEMRRVLERIEEEGPLMARNFEGDGKKVGVWRSKSAKMALENLYMQGDLMVPTRVNFQKVYDLTERVLPNDIDTKIPTTEEYARYLILSYLRANGIGQVSEMVYLLKGVKSSVIESLNLMLISGEVVKFNVDKCGEYFALPQSLSLLSASYKMKKLHILSPFDNLLIQRKRMQSLFDFDYLIECYTPESKRKFGYFCLPILWGGALVARMDCKANRKESRLDIFHLAMDSKLKKIDDFMADLTRQLPPFMAFNGCESMTLHKTTLNGRHIDVLPKLLNSAPQS